MSDITRDPLLGPEGPVPLAPGERLIAQWQADPRVYWQGAVTLGAVSAVGVGGVLVFMGNPNVLVGGLGAVAAIAVRAWYLASEALGFVWRLTDRRLIGPGGRIVPLAQVRKLRHLFGDVQVVTTKGDKHLMRNMGDPKGVIAQIETAAADLTGQP
jgi:hypothetical protein